MVSATARVWQFADARAQLSDVFELALVQPQIIQHRNRSETVLVSRDYFERTKPTLKSALLESRGAGEQEDDPFEAALAQVRANGATVLSPRNEG